MHRARHSTVTAILMVVAFTAPMRSTAAPPTASPLAFVENRGQADARVRFYAQGSRYAFYLTASGAMLSLVRDTDQSRGVVLGLRFVNANPDVVTAGARPAAGYANYIVGSEAARWRLGVPRFEEVVYRDVWPHIDMRIRGEDGSLKYEFHVRPGGRTADIRLGYDGAASLAIAGDGQLAVATTLGTIRDARPVAYQQVRGTQVAVTSRYVVDGNEYGFSVGPYDAGADLVIDPALEYSTFLGGASHDSAAAVAVDAAGNAYVTEFTQSPNFPTTAGAFDRTGAASNSLDAFVTKFSPTGAVVYSTFLGGDNFEWGRAIAVDAAGNACVAGQTKSSNFPTTGGAFDRSFNVDTCPRCGIDQYDAFVTKLNAAGSGLVYSTFLGGFDLDDALAIAVDGSGNAYVGGETGSSNFPVTTGAFDRTRNGAFDVFATKLNATGSALVYSTYLGGLEVEFSSGVAVDAGGQAVFTGITRSADFPTTPGAFDVTHNGMFDAFVTRLNASGSGLVFSTFLGGSDFDSASGVALDAGGNAYVAGTTPSADFPTTVGAFDRTLADSDAFVTKLDPAGTALIYSTLVGGSQSDSAASVIVDASGSAWITGGTSSPDFPTTPGTAFDSTANGAGDAYLAQLDPGGAVLIHGTFLGGIAAEGGSDLAFDPGGNIVVVGQTMSADFPTTAGAFDRVWNGDPLIFWADAFVAKFAVGAPVPTPPPPPPPPPLGSLTAPALISPANDARFRPGATVAFDWSDVSGAASYQIQIDNSQTFAAPFTVDRTVTTSQFTASGLPTTRMWWRVRALGTAGVTGPWSSVRRFEVKN